MLNAPALDIVRTRSIGHPALVLSYQPPARVFNVVMDYLVATLPAVTQLESQHLDVSSIESKAKPPTSGRYYATDAPTDPTPARLTGPVDPAVEGTRRYFIILKHPVTHAPYGCDYRAAIAFGAGVGSGLINVWLLPDVDEARKLWDALNILANP